MNKHDDIEKRVAAPKHGVNTMLSHTGRDPSDFHGFVNPPVVRASTVCFPDVQSMEDTSEMRFTYGLHGTPTTEALCSAIDALEQSAGTVLVPSGLAAVTIPILAVAEPGCRLLVPDNVYGPTRRFCDQTAVKLGMETVYYDPLIGAGISDLFKEQAKTILFVEAPGSYTFEMPDLTAFLVAAREHNAVTMIDNTWATPLFYKPIPSGFDLSIQAGTKYFGGHSDLLIGSISANEKFLPALQEAHRNLGLQAGTEEVFLTLRGLRTMNVRLERQEKAALAVASWLQQQPFVSRILHPGMESDPGYAMLKEHFNGRSSGLFGFEINGSREQARTMLNTLTLFGLGYSWGGFESLAVLAQISALRTVRPWDGGPLIRLSIGLEDVEDLQDDLLNAASTAGLPVSR
ncbi:MAG: cystathionine beta-lyase [Pseudomonadota bacterium]